MTNVASLSSSASRAKWRRVIRDRHLYVLLLPVFAYYIVFHFVPMYGLVMAFQDFNIFGGIRGSTWIRLENFRMIFSNDEFFIVLRNTLMLNVISTIMVRRFRQQYE